MQLKRRTLLVVAMLVCAAQASPVQAQEEGAEAEEHGHLNAVSLFLGGVTHLGTDGDPNESGFGIGVEFARRVASRVKLGLLAEYAFTESERDFIVALPLFLHLSEEFVLVAAPGVEFEVEEEGTETHKETNFLMRFGAMYEIEFASLAFAPQVHGDLVSGRWTWVYGIGIGIAL